jgi:hypothetical protein
VSVSIDYPATLTGMVTTFAERRKKIAIVRFRRLEKLTLSAAPFLFFSLRKIRSKRDASWFFLQIARHAFRSIDRYYTR